MKLRKVAMLFSIVLLLTSIGALAVNGLQFGLDFTGGSLVEIGYEQAVDLNSVRSQLKVKGYEDALVQTFGSSTDIIIRLGQSHDAKLGDKVLAALQQNETQNLKLLRSEFVGAQVGEELREQGGMGMLLALLMIMLYVAFRFQLKFSVGAVVALVHDVLIVLGIFALLKLNFDLTVLAAILAVIGYSLNDTIVVSDRIRENFRKMRKSSAIEIMNVSLSQTLGRTLVTSLTTLLVLVALAIFGGEMIHGFAIALLIGVFIGTYSSIYVAANMLLMMNICKEDLMPPENKEQTIDELP